MSSSSSRRQFLPQPTRSLWPLSFPGLGSALLPATPPRYLCEAEIDYTKLLGSALIVPASPIRSNPGPRGAPSLPLPCAPLHLPSAGCSCPRGGLTHPTRGVLPTRQPPTLRLAHKPPSQPPPAALGLRGQPGPHLHPGDGEGVAAPPAQVELLGLCTWLTCSGLVSGCWLSSGDCSGHLCELFISFQVLTAKTSPLQRERPRPRGPSSGKTEGFWNHPAPARPTLGLPSWSVSL